MPLYIFSFFNNNVILYPPISVSLSYVDTDSQWQERDAEKIERTEEMLRGAVVFRAAPDSIILH
jgi:hypothetical protein